MTERTDPWRQVVGAGALSAAAGRRHAVENLLHRYAELADDRDAAGLGDLLSGATLSFAGGDVRKGSRAITEHYTAAYEGAPASRHVVTNVIVEPAGGDTVHARCRYLRWLLTSRPELVAVGEYQALVSFADGPVGVITAFTVTRSWAA